MTPTCSGERCASCRRSASDALQLSILTPLPGTPLFDEFEAAGRITDPDWSHYDFRHVVIRAGGHDRRGSCRTAPTGSTPSSTAWTGSCSARLRGLWLAGPLPALFCWRLNMTYRYDNRREGIVAATRPGSRLASGRLGAPAGAGCPIGFSRRWSNGNEGKSGPVPAPDGRFPASESHAGGESWPGLAIARGQGSSA